jgi:hypothetical protein
MFSIKIFLVNAHLSKVHYANLAPGAGQTRSTQLVLCFGGSTRTAAALDLQIQLEDPCGVAGQVLCHHFVSQWEL